MTRRYLSTPRTRNPWRTWEPPDHRQPWQHRAACRGDPSESWFTTPSFLPYRERDRLARACRGCPVTGQCHAGAVREQATHVTRAGTWWRSSSNGHGRPLVEPWTELWLGERRLPSGLFRQQAEDE